MSRICRVIESVWIAAPSGPCVACRSTPWIFMYFPLSEKPLSGSNSKNPYTERSRSAVHGYPARGHVGFHDVADGGLDRPQRRVADRERALRGLRLARRHGHGGAAGRYHGTAGVPHLDSDGDVGGVDAIVLYTGAVKPLD